MNFEWLYFCKEQTIESIVNCVDKNYDVDCWKELGIIEVSLEKTSIDFELIDKTRWDDLCKNTAGLLCCETIYQVTLSKGADKWAKDMMNAVCSNIGGRFCEDTEDLKPYIE